jgi:hypothetical protein
MSKFLAILTVSDEEGANGEGFPLHHLFKSLRSAKGWVEHVAETRDKIVEESDSESAYTGPWWVECAEVYEADVHGALTRVDGIKIFQLNECDWWAGPDLESCIAAAIDQLSLDRDEVVDNKTHELTDAEADTLTFVEWDDPVPDNFTFRKALECAVTRGDKFPQSFASTEW